MLASKIRNNEQMKKQTKRRDFIKTAAAASVATVVGGSASVVGCGYEYALRCVKAPDDYGMRNVRRIAPAKTWVHAVLTTWVDTEAYIDFEKAVRVGVAGSGPIKGEVKGFFTFRGVINGHYSDDVDDGTPVKDFGDLGESPYDQDLDDVTNAATQIPRCTIVLEDGPTGKCSWTPNVLSVHTSSVDDLTVSATVKPLVGIIGLAAVATPEVTMGLSLQYKGAGANYQVTRPDTTRLAGGDLLWDLEVVKRPIGCGYGCGCGCGDWGWVRHCPVTLEKPPTIG